MASVLWIEVIDSAARIVARSRVAVTDAGGAPLAVREVDARWRCECDAATATIEAAAPGYAPETHRVRLRDGVVHVRVGLRRPGELGYSHGDSRFAFKPDPRAHLVKVRGHEAAARFARAASDRGLAWRSLAPPTSGDANRAYAEIAGAAADAARLADDLRSRGLDVQLLRVVRHGDDLVRGLANELIMRFADDVSRADAGALAASAGLVVAREVRHAGNAYLLAMPGPATYDVLAAADALAASGRTLYVEPNLTMSAEADQYAPNDPLWPAMTYLPLVRADGAWQRLGNIATDLRGGSPAITIAVIDDQGVAPNHPDLAAVLSDGTAKLVASINFAASPIVMQDVAGLGGDHGTQCAGAVTAAFDDARGLPGVAPNCHLIGVRIDPNTQDLAMADIYLWAAGFMNGATDPGFPAAPPAHAADVVSSSWGVSGVALSNVLRDCFDYLTTYGRGGKGCTLCFSIGNTGYLDFSVPGPKLRAWAAYERTLGVGASVGVNPTSPIVNSVFADPTGHTGSVAVATDTRALYSPYGSLALRKPDLVAPSSTAWTVDMFGASVEVDRVMSAVRAGTGTTNGCVAPAICDDYARTFGGTSAATPIVAGAIALLLSARPQLNWIEVREILRRTCARIDNATGNGANADAIGLWRDLDGDGVPDYSAWYGAGRIDIDAALAMALDASQPVADVYVRDNLGDDGDVASTGDWSESPDVWVRQDASEAVPALAWTDPPPHQNVLRGQDNAIFCRVRNRGTAAAAVVYVRVLIAHWGGLEFAYPQDFTPSTFVGAQAPAPLAPGSYLVGEARVDDLAPNTDRIVRITWPQALIPPASFDVGGTPVAWHPCLLLDASPHDGPTPIGGLAVPVQGDNNIAQRNIHIVDPGAPPEAERYIGMMMGSGGDSGVAALRIDATRLRDDVRLRVHAADAATMDCLRAGVARAVTPPVHWRAIVHEGLDALELTGLRAPLEIPLPLAAGHFVPLLVALVGGGGGDVTVTQRRGDGMLSAGYRIRRQPAR
ncbi:MAG TPA: S8 family serine peptidase [Casimicrobiaceae bacterium]|jgi:subtilisin family serine protease